MHVFSYIKLYFLKYYYKILRLKEKNIKQKQIALSKIIGKDQLEELLKNNVIQSSDWNCILSLAEDIYSNPDSRAYLKQLNYSDAAYWRQPLINILFSTELFKGSDMDYRILADFIILLSSNWNTPLSILLSKMKLKGISVDNYFNYERKVSFYLATIIHDINELQKIIIPQMHCDISSFSSRLTYAFLLPNIYYLEEYGLPRMISRKIQDNGIINLEEESKKMSDIVKEFLAVGYDVLIKRVLSLDEFDKKYYNAFMME